MKMKCYSCPFIIAVILLLFSAQSIAQANNKGWKAGVSSVIITPRQSMWMAGYGNRTKPSEGTLTDLWAKALALEDENGKRVVLVTADLVGIPKDLSNRVRDQLGSKFNLSRSEIIINTSHTHSGPVLSNALSDIYPLDAIQQQKIDQYTNELGEQLVKLVGQAFKALQPVQLFSGNGVTRFQVNRRNNNETALVKQIALEGPNDYAVPVIKVVDNTGKLLAVAFGYACHNTVLNGYQFSGDYAGFAQIELEKSYPGATALFMQGCGANLNPLPRRTVALAKQYGQELAAAVRRILDEDMRKLAPQLNTAYAEVELPLNPPPGKEELSKKAVQSSEDYQKRWASRLLRKMESGEAILSSYPYPIEVWKIGDQPLITLGGEVVVEYANELKRIFGHEIFVLGYSNDVMAYIPNLTILREGGYEGASSQMVYGLPNTWKVSIETLIIQQVMQLAKQVGLPTTEAKID